jgi:septal ring factor EnvC (AmiA/AmiB activator)
VDLPLWVTGLVALLGAGTTAYVALKRAPLERRKTSAEIESTTVAAAKAATEAALLVLSPLQATIATLQGSIAMLTGTIVSLNGEITALRQDIRDRDATIAILRAGEPT